MWPIAGWPSAIASGVVSTMTRSGASLAPSRAISSSAPEPSSLVSPRIAGRGVLSQHRANIESLCRERRSVTARRNADDAGVEIVLAPQDLVPLGQQSRESTSDVAESDEQNVSAHALTGAVLTLSIASSTSPTRSSAGSSSSGSHPKPTRKYPSISKWSPGTSSTLCSVANALHQGRGIDRVCVSHERDRASFGRDVRKRGTAFNRIASPRDSWFEECLAFWRGAWRGAPAPAQRARDDR